MASFTDAISTFNPYVSQLPIIEEMTKLGMEKQAKYDQGIQKIQGQIDNVAGMDVYRDVDKSVLQSKLNQLGSNLKKVAASDFSNFQLVNSVGGMASQIIKDPTIQAAVSSTANIRQQQKEMEIERKKGTLNPANLLNYQSKLSSYANSTDIKDAQGNPVVFSGKYTPYFDVDKFTKETFDAIKPDGLTYEQIYETNPDGSKKLNAKGAPIFSPIITKMEKEGIFPKKVKATLDQIFSDPRVTQQLAITGQYDYRNYTPELLKEKILGEKTKVIGEYNDNVANLLLRKGLTKNEQEKKDIQEQIDILHTVTDNVNTQYDEYAKVALDNPEAVRGMLHTSDVKLRYTTMYGQIKEKESTLNNPGADYNLKLLEEANEQSRFAQRLAFDIKKEQNDQLIEQRNYEQRERLAKPKAPTKTPTPGNQASNINESAIFDADYNSIATDFTHKADAFIWNAAFKDNPKNIANLNKLKENGLSEETAIAMMIDEGAKAVGETKEGYRARWGEKATIAYSKLPPKDRSDKSLSQAYTLYSQAKTDFDGMSSINQLIKSRETAMMAPVLASIQPIVISDDKNNVLELSKEDTYKAAVLMNAYVPRTESRSFALGVSTVGDLGKEIENHPYMKYFNQKGLGKAIASIAKSEFQSSGINTSAVRMLKDRASLVKDGEERVKKSKNDIVKSVYSIDPNTNISLLTGNAEADRGTVLNIRDVATGYNMGRTINESPDFKDFAAAVGKDIKDVSINATARMGSDGIPVVEVVAYDANQKRVGGMTISSQEASNLNINVEELYVPAKVRILESVIKAKGGQSSTLPVADEDTYFRGDAVMKSRDFPLMTDPSLTVNANFKKMNGQYYPYVFVTDGKKTTVKSLEGSDNLHELMMTLQKTVTPSFSKLMLMQQ